MSDGVGMARRLNRMALGLVAGLCIHAIAPASANESTARRDGAKVLASADTADQAAPARTPRKPEASAAKTSEAKGPYYVDFRARTAASWGHAFVWYGKTSERAVEVAGLTPAGDTTSYIIGYFTWVPSETGASYGDLDPQYLTAHYKVYLNEADAKRVFAFIKHL